MTFYSSLHGLRGLAALSVLLFHWSQFFPIIRSYLTSQYIDLGLFFDFGWLGVPLFFILSGFVLANYFIENKDISHVTVLRFYSRRLARIYPALWLQFLILYVMSLFSIEIFDFSSALSNILNFILYVNLPPFMTAPINGVWWTLPIELSFYFILPLFMLFSFRFGVAWLVLICLAVTLCWRIGVFYNYSDTSSYLLQLPILDALPGTVFVFSLGMLLAFYKDKLRFRSFYIVVFMLFFPLCILWLKGNVESYWTGSLLLIFWPSVVAILISLGVWISIKSEIISGFLSNKFFIYSGSLSYGIYLWHYPVIKMVDMYYGKGEGLYESFFILMFVLFMTFVISHISYKFVEGPVIKWIKYR